MNVLKKGREDKSNLNQTHNRYCYLINALIYKLINKLTTSCFSWCSGMFKYKNSLLIFVIKNFCNHSLRTPKRCILLCLEFLFWSKCCRFKITYSMPIFALLFQLDQTLSFHIKIFSYLVLYFQSYPKFNSGLVLISFLSVKYSKNISDI